MTLSEEVDHVLCWHSSVLARAEQLRPMPGTIPLLVSAVGSPDSEIDDICDVIRQDQVLAAHVLRIANSAWSHARAPIGTLEGAVVRLGTAMVVTVGIGLAVGDELAKPLPAYAFAVDDPWRHAYVASVAAEVVRDAARAPVPPEAPAAALVHDIGKVVLDDLMRPEQMEVLRAACGAGAMLVEAELEALTLDHAEVGAAIARAWRFPPSVVEAVRRHHDPGDCGDAADLLSCVLYLADLLSHMAAAEMSTVGVERPDVLATVATALEALGVVPVLLPDLVAELERRVAARAPVFDAIRTGGAAASSN